MTRKTVNIGVIGTGGVGERVLQAFERHGGANVLGVSDANTERLNYISEKYNAKADNDYRELIENTDIDLIYLAVPPKHHHKIAKEIIQNKKHILCEKPLANSVDEAREMLELAEENNIIHAMNFPTIYREEFKKLESMLKEGFIGNPRRVELNAYFQQWPRTWQQNNWISSREQGGLVREVFSHYIQMTQMLFGSLNTIQSQVEYPEDNLKSETGIIATARLDNGVPVLFNSFSDIGMEEHISYSIYGSEGTLTIVNWKELWISKRGQGKTKVEVEEEDNLVNLIEEVFKAIDNNLSKIITFKEGYEVQKVLERLLQG
jgi:predicted dehydrogenase